MTGLGEDYYVQVAGGQGDMSGRYEASGFLADGEKLSREVKTGARESEAGSTQVETGESSAISEGFPIPVISVVFALGAILLALLVLIIVRRRRA